MNPSAVPPKQPDRRKIPSDGFLFLNPSESRTGAGVRYGSDCRKTLLEKGLAEFRRPQTTEGKEAPSFSATCASEMTPRMTDRATFLQESSPVRHASLCRKRPLAFFDKLRLPGFAGQPDFTLFGACHSASGPGRTRRQRPAPRRCRAAPTRKKKK